MEPGIIPSLHFPGEITPGQFGPINLVPGFLLNKFVTLIISRTGTPSVMQIINSILASMASIMAALVNLAGTKITLVQADVSSTASLTFSKTGFPR